MNQAGLLLAQEHGGGGLSLILPATAELIWGVICFAVVAFVLMRVAFPAIRKTIEARETNIQSALEEAEKSKSEAHEMLEEYKKQLAEGIVARAGERIEAERNRTVQELQGQIAQMSIDLAEKVVGRSLDGESQREFVDAYIKEVAGMSGDGKGA